MTDSNASSSDEGMDSNGASSNSSSQGVTSADITDDASDSSGDPQGYCSVFEENLIACYEFEEIDNNTIADGSMFSNHIHISDSKLSTFGYWGKALESADGFEAYARDSDIFNVGGFTLAVAIYPHRIDQGRYNGIIDNDKQYALFIEGNNILCNDGNRWVMASTPRLNQWTRVVCTSDQERLRLYIEGMLVDELTPLDADREENNNPISIANMSPEFNEPFIGLIDNMRIWNRALRAREVAGLEG